MAMSDLLTLTEVSNRTGISMPTLQRYKKEYQDRIPSEGEGRKQRYPESALPVFEEIKAENIKRRGRPARAKSPGRRAGGQRKPGRGRRAGGRRKASSGSGSSEGLLSLAEIGRQTGISYPTLQRYVKLHGSKIPFEGRGRKRRYHPEAVEIFRELRSQSRRGGGRRKGSGRKAGGGRRAGASGGGDAALAHRIQALEKSVRELTALVKKPIKVTLNR